MMSTMNERGVDFGDHLDRSFDRDFRNAVKVGVGENLSSELVRTVDGLSVAASVPGASTAGLLLGHV